MFCGFLKCKSVIAHQSQRRTSETEHIFNKKEPTKKKIGKDRKFDFISVQNELGISEIKLNSRNVGNLGFRK